jgi:hypothetical protein
VDAGAGVTVTLSSSAGRRFFVTDFWRHVVRVAALFGWAPAWNEDGPLSARDAYHLAGALRNATARRKANSSGERDCLAELARFLDLGGDVQVTEA